MFRKQLADWKTSAPLRNSDRKKLKLRVEQVYNDADADLLVPDGLLSVKFTTHSGEQGVAYLSPERVPLWFTLGKGQGESELIPTVYTLWKNPTLLPRLSTPDAVIPVLQNGADLMAAGVVDMLGTPTEGQLVSITRYCQDARGPPLAVGSMAMSVAQVREDKAKGKAVFVLHVYKDKLWEMGGRGEPPEPEVVIAKDEVLLNGDAEEGRKGEEDVESINTIPSSSGTEIIEESSRPSPPPLSPQEVSSILRTSLIQAIHSTLSSLPQSSFPLPSTLLYTNHILTSRPVHLPTSNSNSTPPQIDIKHSSHKNLTSFLRSLEKESLLRLRLSGNDVQILSVNADHPDVQTHRAYTTIGDVDARREKKAERERQESEKMKMREVEVTELWKPHQESKKLFEECRKDSSALYTHQELKEIINEYILAHSLVNSNKRQFINTDDLLRDVLRTKGQGDTPEFIKREDLLKRLEAKMQPWHRVEVEGKDAVVKKGKLTPISISTKLRQGRKACTLLTHFEPFQLDADALAEELRRLCAGATSVSPLPGKGAGMEVMVQGRQAKVVKELLVSKGVPRAWIEESDLVAGKK